MADKIDFARGTRKYLNSAVWGKFCEEVYGANLQQSGMVDMPMLKLVLKELSIKEGDCVLDVGCGFGGISQYIANYCQCEVHGIDLIVQPTSVHAENTSSKRTFFYQMDMEDLAFDNLKFDKILVLDTLYFSTDVVELLKSLKKRLKENGTMGLLFNEDKETLEQKAKLTLHNISMETACQQANLSFESYDLTIHLENLWKKMEQALPKYAESLIEEGNFGLFLERDKEIKYVAQLIKEGRVSRYLYKVSKQN